MRAKLASWLRKYRDRIRPPYTHQDLPALGMTALLALILPAMVVTALSSKQVSTDAAGNTQIVFLDPVSLKPVESITYPEVKVLLTAPWPISFAGEGQVAGDSTSKSPKGASGSSGAQPTKEQGSSERSNTPKVQVTNTPGIEATTTPLPAITSSIVLAQDANFEQNLVTISPVTSNPYLVSYTFLDASPGTKNLFVKFVSSLGTTAVYNKSIQLVSTTSTPAPEDSGGIPGPAIGSGGFQPFVGAPLCPDSGVAHDTAMFHTLWDSNRGCHYDHEHGENPFTEEMAETFPREILGTDLKELLGNVEIAHTNHSGPAENTSKHGGFKWQVQTTTPNDCALGFEDAQVAVNAIAAQYHAFGDYSIEFNSRVHSAMALMRQCLTDSDDYGYVYTVQHVDYGQRVSGYQGDIIPFTDNPNPAYPDGLAPYFTIDCIGRASPPCGRYTSYEQYVSANGNASTTWTSKTPQRLSTGGSSLLAFLIRARDTYQILDFSDSEYPFKFMWLCSRDGGLSYTSYPGCRHNNSTTRIHEVGGTIPSSWDNLTGFDNDPRVGRITADGFTTRFGALNFQCSEPDLDCHPIKLVNAYVGRYGSLLHLDKVVSFSADTLPERDIYFCNGVACPESASGARSSGWIGQSN